MVHTMDLGVSEAYRHEAGVEWVETLAGPDRERIVVRCGCGESWESFQPVGTFDAAEDGDWEAEERFLKDWERHVWQQIKAAGQFEAAQANSLASSEDDGRDDSEDTDMCPSCGWSKFAAEDRCHECRTRGES